MDSADLEDRLTELLDEAGRRHHAAYIDSDGADPEWALWYASFVQARFWDAAGTLPTRSRLVYLLIDAERAYAAAGANEPWPRFYARRMLADLVSAPESG